MQYFTDLTLVGGVFISLTFAVIIMLQIILALAIAISLKSKKSVN